MNDFDLTGKGRWAPTWWQGWHWRWLPRHSEWRPLTPYPCVWFSVEARTWVGSSGLAIRNGFKTSQDAAKWALAHKHNPSVFTDPSE
jgi:hypothetical protein